MANIYGSCYGSSCSKYNLWLNITQNSQNISGNTSNITVKLYLKRNDGYSASAYCLTASSNTAKISINNVNKINTTLPIDTRGGATVLLASWTGNVSHNSNGKLSVPISGSFTIGAQSLNGGSVSGSFTCTTIPRASSLSFSSSSVTPGGNITCNITAAHSSFSHKINFKIGSNSTTIDVASGDNSVTHTISSNWASSITKSASGEITVTLTTYSDSTKIGSKIYSLKLTVPSNDTYKPDFDITLTRVDNSAPSEWGVYVQNISTVSVNIENASYKAGATYKSALITVCGAQKSALPSVFSLTKSGSVTVSVKITDSRGISRTKTTTVSVEEYTAPNAEITELNRCDENGNINAMGEYIKLGWSINCSAVANKNTINLFYGYKVAGSESYIETQITTTAQNELITSGSIVIGGGNISTSESYDVYLKISDTLTTESMFTRRSVSTGGIPFNIKKGGKAVGIGTYAGADGTLSLGLNLILKDGAVVKKQLYNGTPVFDNTNVFLPEILTYSALIFVINTIPVLVIRNGNNLYGSNIVQTAAGNTFLYYFTGEISEDDNSLYASKIGAMKLNVATPTEETKNLDAIYGLI